jgi:hypothetical protein
LICPRARGGATPLITEKDLGKPPELTEDSGTQSDKYVEGPDGHWGIKRKSWFPYTEQDNPDK